MQKSRPTLSRFFLKDILFGQIKAICDAFSPCFHNFKTHYRLTLKVTASRMACDFASRYNCAVTTRNHSYMDDTWPSQSDTKTSDCPANSSSTDFNQKPGVCLIFSEFFILVNWHMTSFDVGLHMTNFSQV